jgi:hypothetical protein
MDDQNFQQNIQLPPEFVPQFNLLNARITNANLANVDLLKEIDSVFKAMATRIAGLEKENAELKAKTVKTFKDDKS